MKRKEFIRNTSTIAISGMVVGNINASTNSMFNSATHTPFTQTALPYTFEALEPSIDAQTMQIHHTKHHAAYVKNLNEALSKIETEVPTSLESILKNISTYPVSVRNNGGGHFNHEMFWKVMKPGKSAAPTGKISEAINSSFGSFENFKAQFTDAAKSRFGSGWAWLVKQDKKLVITSTANQDNPLMDVVEVKGTPLLCLDVWEHAYYLKYQNLRADYVSNWWNIVNWDEVASRL
jgi:Fe-Mn family superoxide dismutase